MLSIDLELRSLLFEITVEFLVKHQITPIYEHESNIKSLTLGMQKSLVDSKSCKLLHQHHVEYIQ